MQRTARLRPQHHRAVCTATAKLGLGYCSPALTGASQIHLFKAMMHHIDQPSEFLPVSRVRIQPAMGAAPAAEGAIMRSMHYDGPGPVSGKTIMDHVYTDPDVQEIRFVSLLPSGKEGELESCLVLLTDPLRIEYYQRSRATRKRVASDAPLDGTIKAVEVTLALARAAQAEADDPTFVGVKA